MFNNKEPPQSQWKNRMWDVRMVRTWRWILWWCLYCLFLQQWAGGWQQRPGHACQKILMRECVSEDAEGRSGAVPLMVSARELKCIPLTAWERETTPVLRLRTDAPVPGGQWTSPPGVLTFKETKKEKKTASDVSLPVWSLFSSSNWSIQAVTEAGFSRVYVFVVVVVVVHRGAAATTHGNNGTSLAARAWL